MKNFKLIALGLMGSAIIASCSDDDDSSGHTMDEGDTILELAEATDELSILVQALEKAGLSEVFNDDDDEYTVFAPTNAAFQNLLDSNPSWSSLDDIPMDVLKQVLKYHVVDSKIKSDMLSDTYVPTLAEFMYNGDDEEISLPINTTGGVKFDGDTNPVNVDIEASNGVIHTVDKVMLPNNLVEFALDNPQFSSLVSALTVTGLQNDYVSILSGDGPFTVFMPNNQAFQNLLDSQTTWNDISDVPVNILEQVLRYHVVAGANVQAEDLEQNQEIPTLDGTILTVDKSNGVVLVTVNGQRVNVVTSDIQGTNGVAHEVDQVLIPLQ